MDTRQLQESNSWIVITTVMVLTPISTIFVIARIYSCHVKHQRRLFLEEWLCVVSLLFLLLGAAFATKLSLSGGGRHWALLTDTERTNTRFWYWLWTLPAGFILSVPNMAVVSLLCRLFKPRRSHTILLWSIGVICNLNFVFGFILQLFRCKPLRSPWDVGDEQCWDKWVYVRYSLYAAVYSAAADLCLAVYPALVLRQLPWSHKKVALCFMLGLSIFATGVACYKTPLLRNIASDDFSYQISELVIWTMVEGYVVLIAACVPTLHPVYDRFTGRSRSITPTGPRLPRRRGAHPHHNTSTSKQSFWSTLHSTRRWSFSGGGGGGGRTIISSTVDMANPRTLEDAANLAYPPAAIWTQTVRVGQHSRLRSQDHESF